MANNFAKWEAILAPEDPWLLHLRAMAFAFDEIVVSVSLDDLGTDIQRAALLCLTVYGAS